MWAGTSATTDWRARRESTPLCQSTCQKTAHQTDAFPGLCTFSTRARVCLPRSQTGVSFKATNRSRFRIDLWFAWWERGRGIVGTHKHPTGVQTLSSTRGRSLGSGTSPWQENIALVHQSQRRYVCPWLVFFSTSSSVLIGVCPVVLSPSSTGSLSQGGSESRKSFLVSGHSLLLIQKQWITPRRRTKRHLSIPTLPLCLLSVVADPRSHAAFRFSLQLQPIRGTDVRKRKEEQSGHTVRAVKRQQTKGRLSRSSHPKWIWSREKPVRSYLGFSCCT